MTQLTYSENGCIIVSKKYDTCNELRQNLEAVVKEARETYGKRIIEMIVREDNMTFDVKLRKE